MNYRYKERKFPDLFILLPSLLLVSLSILVIYSSDERLAFQQVAFALMGIVIFWVLSWLDIELFRGLTKHLYLGLLGLLVVVFILGLETRGVVRWIPLGDLRIQPSEFAKPILVLLLADFWTRNYPSWKNIGKSFLYIFPVVVMIFRQPDLGTTLVLLVVWWVMLFASNVSIIKLLLIVVVVLAMTPLGWMFLKDYQRERFSSFVFPQKDPLGSGYNMIQSTIAVGSGQLFGRTLGHGTQSRLQFLPEYRTDFIFASIAEEFGFIGSLLMLGLYTLLLARCFKILHLLQDRFNSLVVVGILSVLLFQIVVNVGMNVGILPITGITLPLLSYGGSSLVSTLISLGLVSSITKTSNPSG